jgi:uncharacterized membrane protein
MYGTSGMLLPFDILTNEAGGGNSMTAFRFTKAFQLTALVLVFAVAQVYVMAGPIRANTDPKAKETTSASEPRSEAVVTNTATTPSAESQLLTPGAAAERMPLTAGSKALFNRIFSKRDVETRLASGNTFIKAQANFKDTFKSPGKNFVVPQSDDDDDDGGHKGMWIAAGVVAAVVVIAIIGLRHDREITSVQE